MAQSDQQDNLPSDLQTTEAGRQAEAARRRRDLTPLSFYVWRRVEGSHSEVNYASAALTQHRSGILNALGGGCIDRNRIYIDVKLTLMSFISMPAAP